MRRRRYRYASVVVDTGKTHFYEAGWSGGLGVYVSLGLQRCASEGLGIGWGLGPEFPA